MKYPIKISNVGRAWIEIPMHDRDGAYSALVMGQDGKLFALLAIANELAELNQTLASFKPQPSVVKTSCPNYYRLKLVVKTPKPAVKTPKKKKEKQ